MAVEGLDTNKDGVYAKEELAPLAKVNVESLKEFDYFTFVRLGAEEKPLPLKEPVDYWVDYDKTVLTLHFTLPLERPLDPKAQEIMVDVYDPSFFVAFGFAADAPVKIAGSPAPGCAAEVQKPDAESEADTKALSEAFFSQLGPNSNFGSQFAQTVTVKCKDSPMKGVVGFARAFMLASLFLLLADSARRRTEADQSARRRRGRASPAFGFRPAGGRAVSGLGSARPFVRLGADRQQSISSGCWPPASSA